MVVSESNAEIIMLLFPITYCNVYFKVFFHRADVIPDSLRKFGVLSLRLRFLSLDYLLC